MEAQLHAAATQYKIVPGYPKTIASEVNQAIVPSSVNAAHCDGTTVYQLSGNMMYQYRISNAPPTLTYTYITHFDLTQNQPGNHFSAGPSSPLPSAPSGITALHMDEANTKLMAIAGKKLYTYCVTSGDWVYHGVIATPC